MADATPDDDAGDRERPAGHEPQDLAAQDFMDRKGLGQVKPLTVQPQGPGYSWIYTYLLPDGGELDLRVTWREDLGEWDWFVEDFYKR